MGLMKQRLKDRKQPEQIIPADELVEDAGLAEVGIRTNPHRILEVSKMTTSSIRITAKPKTLTDSEIVVGKDILELLANAMYIDPLTIYREYVQNAADSIDEARVNGLTIDDPKIDIEIDHATRFVRIRDNGEGISNAEFVKRITSIGASHKEERICVVSECWPIIRTWVLSRACVPW
ncbi:MAG: hypothetical protein IPJ25_11050 [Rhodocyclaceae bacterium]|nr:hypothetical protein [Rhodocyclaceae bacterium]